MDAPGSTEHNLVLEKVPPAAADEATEILVSDLGYIVKHARALVSWAPIPCATDTRERLEALQERLQGAGAVASIAPAPRSHGRCASHAQLAAATACQYCSRPMCLLCRRLGTPKWCADCADKVPVRRARNWLIAVLAAVMLLIAGRWWLDRRATQQAATHTAVAVEGARPDDPGKPVDIPLLLTTEEIVDEDDVADEVAPIREPVAGGNPNPLSEVWDMIRSRRFEEVHDLLKATEGSLEARDLWAHAALRAAKQAVKAKKREWVRRFTDLGLRRYGAERDSLLVLRAALARDEGRIDDCIADARQVSSIGEERADGLALLGDCLHKKGDMEGARSTFESLVRLGGKRQASAREALARLTRVERGTKGYETFTSTHFTLRCAPSVQTLSAATVAENILRLLEDNLRRITADLGPIGSSKIPAVAYNRADYENRFGRGTIGLYHRDDGTLSIKDAVATDTDPVGREVLAHELTHAILDRILAGRTIPRWMNEGLSRYQGRIGAGMPPVSDAEWYGLKVLLRKGQLPTLSSIAHYRGRANRMHYYAGSAVASFIEDRFTFMRLREYFAKIRSGMKQNDAFRAAFRVDPAAFEQQFHKYLEDHSTGGVSGQIGE